MAGTCRELNLGVVRLPNFAKSVRGRFTDLGRAMSEVIPSCGLTQAPYNYKELGF